MEYRDAILHYYPNLDLKAVDLHFFNIFSYAKTEGEELLVIKPKDVPEVDKGNKLGVVEVVPA